MAGHTFRAVSAENRETRDHMVARLDIAHRLADFLDDSRRLVAEHRRRRMGVVAVDEMKVAVAYAARDRPQQHLAILRLVDIDIFDSERLLWPMKHGGFHRDSPYFTSFPRRMDARAGAPSSRRPSQIRRRPMCSTPTRTSLWLIHHDPRRDVKQGAAQARSPALAAGGVINARLFLTLSSPEIT